MKKVWTDSQGTIHKTFSRSKPLTPKQAFVALGSAVGYFQATGKHRGTRRIYDLVAGHPAQPASEMQTGREASDAIHLIGFIRLSLIPSPAVAAFLTMDQSSVRRIRRAAPRASDALPPVPKPPVSPSITSGFSGFCFRSTSPPESLPEGEQVCSSAVLASGLMHRNIGVRRQELDRILHLRSWGPPLLALQSPASPAPSAPCWSCSSTSTGRTCPESECRR